MNSFGKVKKHIIICAIMVCMLSGFSLADDCKAVYGDRDLKIRLATGSPGELGLLEELANAFNGKHNSSMCWIKAGSGKSLQLLKEKKVDIVMVHAPAYGMPH